MTTARRAIVQLLVALLPQFLGLQSALAGEPATPVLGDEISKQESIYQGKDPQRIEGYIVNRSLAAYADALPADFARSLARLEPRDRWLDVGAGEANAILDYYTREYDEDYPAGRAKRGSKASAAALSLEDRRTARWHQSEASLASKKIQYYFGRPFSDYSAQELGQFQIITDLLGGFSYTTNLDRYMEKALELLVTGGRLYTMLQDVHAQEGSNKPYYDGSPYLTQLTDADGAEVKVCSWLQAISCVQVTCKLMPDWKPPIEIYDVKKVCGEVTVPALVLRHFAAGTPPERRFALKKSSSQNPAEAR